MLLKVIKMAMALAPEDDRVKLAILRLLHMQSSASSVPQAVKDALSKRRSCRKWRVRITNTL
jgi:hypothetical protein